MAEDLKVGDVVLFNADISRTRTHNDLKLVVKSVNNIDCTFTYFNEITKMFVEIDLPKECVTKI